MSEQFTDLGIQHILAIWPKNGTNDTVLYMGLFASADGATVPARGITGGATPAGWTEVTGAAYARTVISAAQWGITAVQGAGLRITGTQLTFPSAADNWSEAGGFFIATHVSSQVNDVPVYFANFDGLATYTVASGEVIRVNPGIQLDG